jgi:hypothetical protein
MRLLLDVHIPAAVAGAVRRRLPGLDILHISNWHSGSLLEAEDRAVLAECAREGRVLVSFDLKTIPALLVEWAEAQRSHAGVFLADDKTVRPEKVGAVAASIAELVTELRGTDTTNLVRFLARAKAPFG